MHTLLSDRYDGNLADDVPEYEPAQAELEDLKAIIADQAASAGDEAIRGELAQLRSAALRELGSTPLRVDRTIALDERGRCDGPMWAVIISGVAAGIGREPQEALDDALRALDAHRGIVPAPDGRGYVVAGIAAVAAAPHRPDAEARQHARRMALSQAYLDAAILWQCPGITDLRKARAEPAQGQGNNTGGGSTGGGSINAA